MAGRANARGQFRVFVDRLLGRSLKKGKSVRRTDWRQTFRNRLLVAGLVFAAWTFAIEYRLVVLQVVEHDQYVARARDQQEETIELSPKRGEIVDRNGRILAYSVDADSIYAVPNEVKEPSDAALQLCAVLDDCTEDVHATLGQRLDRDASFAYVKRRASLREARAVGELGLEGIGFLKESHRFYPNRELAAHLLGYVGTDNQGLDGIESTYDDEIKGSPGQVLLQKDATQRAFSRVDRLPTTGATLELTVDKYLQHIAERELQAGVKTHNADAGSVVMLDPHTGEILALASAPTFNPNVFEGTSQNQRRNRAVQDLYEPGSTFKVVTASAAFEERVVHRDEIFDVSAGAIRVGGRVISDYSPNGELSFTDVMVKSSNVGAIRVGLRLGAERLSRYVRRFGFGETLSPDFPSESRGIVWDPSDLNDGAVASIAMGYQVSVTPLQMAAAVAAVANGGELIEPRVVSAVVQNGIRQESEPRVIRRAISNETAAELTSIMESVVERGTARRAQVPGYTVAGKTGTASKLVQTTDPETGRVSLAYSENNNYASFVGFVPSDRPRLVVLVTIDTPRNGGNTGGAVAAPIFQRIVEASLRHLAVVPTVHPASPMLVPSSIVSSKPSLAVVATSTVVNSSTHRDLSDVEPGVMPNLRGLSAREAVRRLGVSGLGIHVVGDGVVVRQQPSAGTEFDQGAVGTEWLERRHLLPNVTRRN